MSTAIFESSRSPDMYNSHYSFEIFQIVELKADSSTA